jgi:23S rRNA-/tRNA-specific pseudouridylate synthase
MAAPRLISRSEEIWVLEKPAGLAVHAAAGGHASDLLSWARSELSAPPELAAVSRLDRETSGLVLCAVGDGRGLAGRWLAEGQVKKRYLALVHGRTHRKGVIRRPLPDPRRRRPLEAVTRYRMLAWLGPLSYLEVRPETGRRHQIRRHLQGVGHPVVGDARHGPRRPPRRVPGFPGRLWLHCHRLSLPDGRELESPLPEDLRVHLELLSELEGAI